MGLKRRGISQIVWCQSLSWIATPSGQVAGDWGVHGYLVTVEGKLFHSEINFDGPF